MFSLLSDMTLKIENPGTWEDKTSKDLAFLYLIEPTASFSQASPLS